MRTKLITLLFISILFNSIGLQAKSKVDLKLNFKKGAAYEMTTVLNSVTEQVMNGTKMKVDQKMETGFSFQVLDIYPNKNFLVEYSIRKMKIYVNIDGQERSFDSESNNGENSMTDMLNSLPKIKLEVTPLGKIIRVEEIDLSTLVGENLMMQFMHVFLGNRSLEVYMGQMFNYFPEASVGDGDKWSTTVRLANLMNLESPMNYEVVAHEKGLMTLKVTSEENLTTPIEKDGISIEMKKIGKQSGTMTIDTKDGWIRSSELVQKFNLNMKMKDPKTQMDTEIPISSDAVFKISVVKK